MARFTKLTVWHQARLLLRYVFAATHAIRVDGDLESQMRRAAVSVVSTIAEGSEHGSDREFRRFLLIANASTAEIEAQITIADDIAACDPDTVHRITEQCRYVGRMLDRLMSRMQPGA